MESSVKVGHFMPQYGTSTGTGQVLENLSRLVHGHKDIEFYIFKHGKDNKLVTSENLKIISYAPTDLNMFPVPFNFLKDLINNTYGLDSICIHMPFTLQNLIVSLVSSIPLYYFPHGCFHPKTLNRKGKSLKKSLYILLVEKWILSNTEKIVCATAKEQSHINNLGYENTVVANFPFKLAHSFGQLNNNFRDKYNFKEEDFLLIFVGRWDIHPKGLDLLIKSTKSANSKNKNVKTVLIGYNVNSDKVEDYIKKFNAEECVFPIGEMYGKDKIEALKGADLYIQASRYESYGVSILEALALEIPCLLSKGCDIAHSINDGGCLKFEHDSESLENSILYAKNNPSVLESIAENGMSWVEKKLSNKNTLKQWEKVYSQ